NAKTLKTRKTRQDMQLKPDKTQWLIFTRHIDYITGTSLSRSAQKQKLRQQLQHQLAEEPAFHPGTVL
ncbi:unnamed protein product, partial [Dovyalis caffra]